MRLHVILKRQTRHSPRSDGFISRRLLRSHDGSYRILVEHESQETFQAMHKNPEHDKVRAKLFEFIDPEIKKSLYTVVSE